jgi:hypothetical protein
LLVRDYKGKEADRLVVRVDPGLFSPVAELRGHQRQAAEERKPLDASLLARALEMERQTLESDVIGR